jgi:hypothetical protein
MFDVTSEEKDHLADPHFANTLPLLKLATERDYRFHEYESQSLSDVLRIINVAYAGWCTHHCSILQYGRRSPKVAIHPLRVFEAASNIATQHHKAAAYSSVNNATYYEAWLRYQWMM